jgi:hypothetical protein
VPAGVCIPNLRSHGSGSQLAVRAAAASRFLFPAVLFESTSCEQDGAHDGSCDATDEILDSISETFLYPVSPTAKAYMQQQQHQETCELDFSLRIDEIF